MTPLPKNRAPWPHEDKLQLIKLVQPHEMIWRAGQKNFTELGERKAALEEVANAFDGRYTSKSKTSKFQIFS